MILGLLRRRRATPRPPWPRRLAAGAAPWLALAAVAALWTRAPPSRPKPRDEVDKAQARAVPGLSRRRQASPEAMAADEPGRGRGAERPRDIPAKGWKDVLWRTYREVNEDRLTIVAGGVTFYALLAIFPSVGVFVSLYGLFADVGEVNKQLNQMAALMPAQALSVVGDQMTRLALERDSNLSLAFVVSLLLSVWSANAGMKALFAGLNVAYDEMEKRNFLVMTATTYVFTLGTLVFLTLVSALLVATPIALEWLGLDALAVLMGPVRWLVLWGVAAGAFSIVYRYGPSRARARWRWVTWGGLIAATLWLGGSLAFSWYVNTVAHFDRTYGPLGAVIGFMMWIWFSVMVLLLGAELNAEIEHQTAVDSTTGPAEPMGERGAAMADSVGLALHFDARARLNGLLGRSQAKSSSRAASRAA